jgi:drug/metabolite transporter (DMT)-like permease
VVWTSIEKKHSLKLISRVIFGLLSTSCNYYSIKNMSLTLVGLLKNVAPLYTAILSYVLLREGITRMEVACLLIAFIGVAVVLNG